MVRTFLPFVLFVFLLLPPAAFSSDHALPVSIVPSATSNLSIQKQEAVAPIKDTSPPRTFLTASGANHTLSTVLYLGRSASLVLSSEDTGEPASGVSAIEYRFDAAGDWKQYAEPISMQNISNGIHTLYYRSLDRSGNSEQPQTVQFFIDADSPVTVLTTGTPQAKNEDGRLFVSSATPFSLSATDDGSGLDQVEYRMDSNGWVVYREPFRIADEGAHRLEYRGMDRTGNIEAVRSLQLTVDNTPPITDIIANNQTPDSSDNIIINGSVAVNLEPYDLLSGIKSTEYRLDQGKWLTYTAPFRVEGSASHAIQFHSIDKVGNQEQTKTVYLKVDRIPPVSTISIGEPHLKASDGSDIVSEISFFTISAKDNLSVVERTEYRVDDEDWEKYQPFTIQKQGRHRIEFRSIDRAGNMETPRHLYVTVMTTPPNSRIVVNGKSYESGADISSSLPFSVAISVKDGGAGVKTTEYRLDGSQWTPFTPFTVSSEGEHIVEVRSIDRLGNIEPTRFVKLVMDRTPPQTELVISEPKRVVNGILHITDKTVLSLSASDTVSGVSKSEYIIEGTGEMYGSEPFNILTSGEYRIRYWSIDRQGNREKERVASVIVDVPKPVAGDAMAKPSRPLQATESKPEGSNTPESIRLTSKPSEANVNKDIPPDQIIPPELMNDPIFKKVPRDATPPADTNLKKKFFTSGGINAVIIAIIMLIL